MTRRERRESRAVTALVARAMRLHFGPCESRREDADEFLAISVTENAVVSTQTRPVRWILTTNRKILETVPQPSEDRAQ